MEEEGAIQEDVKTYLREKILPRAAGYWSNALSVKRARSPLRAEYQREECREFGLGFQGHVFGSAGGVTCGKATMPTCGPHQLTIPDKYLKKSTVCSSHCPDKLTALTHLIGLNRFCETCSELEGGEGAAGVDFHLFVTVTDDFCEGEVQAHATTCVVDQCDRPIFGVVNFCKGKLSITEEDADRQVTTAIHELAHALVFSSHHFGFFRNKDGSPKVPRDPLLPRVLRDAVRWTCDAKGDGTTRYAFPDDRGNREYVDLTRFGVVGSFAERGIDRCDCPFRGKTDMGPHCIMPPQPSMEPPGCVLRLLTPKVTEKARAHFACPRLPGAELENQPTSACSIISSHWEQRVFFDELMAPTQASKNIVVSEVTLAVFEDSGWYMPNYDMSDSLVKGVHWGYQQGCEFATEKCSPQWGNGFCNDKTATSCSPDRRMEVACDARSLPDDAKLSSIFLQHAGTAPMIAASLTEADFCPTFSVEILGRHCTDPRAQTAPYANVNLQREAFGANSRCLPSSLVADLSTPTGIYVAKPDLFSAARPRCYEVRCKPGSYEVWVSNLNGQNVFLGNCVSDGQELTGAQWRGSVGCVPRQELCDLPAAPKHLDPTLGQAPNVHHLEQKVEVQNGQMGSQSRPQTASQWKGPFSVTPLLFALLGAAGLLSLVLLLPLAALRRMQHRPSLDNRSLQAGEVGRPASRGRQGNGNSNHDSGNSNETDSNNSTSSHAKTRGRSQAAPSTAYFSALREDHATEKWALLLPGDDEDDEGEYEGGGGGDGAGRGFVEVVHEV